jgi:hypothetical protein
MRDWIEELNTVQEYLLSPKGRKELTESYCHHPAPISFGGHNGLSFCDLATQFIGEGRQILFKWAGLKYDYDKLLPVAEITAAIQAADKPVTGVRPNIDGEFLWLGILKETADKTTTTPGAETNGKTESPPRKTPGPKQKRKKLADYAEKHRSKKSWVDLAADWSEMHPDDQVTTEMVRMAHRNHFQRRTKSTG